MAPPLPSPSERRVPFVVDYTEVCFGLRLIESGMEAPLADMGLADALRRESGFRVAVRRSHASGRMLRRIGRSGRVKSWIRIRD